MKKRTKIVCTIGPSSWEEKPMRAMIDAGMNVARINGAFADVAEMERVSKLVRSISDEVALMIDTKGHEVRLNKFDEVLYVKTGDEIIIGNKAADGIFPANYPNLYKEIAEGQLIHIDKGETTVKVEKISDGKLFCRVIRGTEIKPGKGLNVPGAHLKNPAVTEKDIEQIEYAIKDNWEYVAASFVRNADDVRTVRSHFKNSPLKLISKIEDQQGVDNIDEIIELSDGIMVARGDLGTEIPIERLPIIQKEIIYKCNMAAKPVITATNMLESMISKL